MRRYLALTMMVLVWYPGVLKAEAPAAAFLRLCADYQEKGQDLKPLLLAPDKASGIAPLNRKVVGLLLQYGSWHAPTAAQQARITRIFKLDHGCQVLSYGRAHVFVCELKPHLWKLLFCENLFALPYPQVSLLLDNGQKMMGQLAGCEHGILWLLKDGHLHKIAKAKVRRFSVEEQPTFSSEVTKPAPPSHGRVLKIHCVSDFLPEKTIEPAVIIADKPYKQQPLSPGTYDLLFLMPGFYRIKKRIVVSPGKGPVVINVKMKTKPRVVRYRISFDVPPGDLGPDYKVSIRAQQNPDEWVVLTNGQKLKPGFYHLKIEKPGYHAIKKMLRLWPAEKPYLIDEQLVAKPVPVELRIDYDIPPAKPQPVFVALTPNGSQNGLALRIKQGDRVKPGVYGVFVWSGGYQPLRHILSIMPSEVTYCLNFTLHAQARKSSGQKSTSAKPRELCLRISDDHKIIFPCQVKVLDKAGAQFLPGTTHSWLLRFKRYQTVRCHIKIPAGEGPLVVPVRLTPLKRYRFALHHFVPEVILDGIRYPSQFYADDTLIEPHLICRERLYHRNYFSIMVPPQAKYLKIVGGYFYSQVPFKRIYRIKSHWQGIDIQRLIKHLQILTTIRENHRVALQVVHELLRQNKQMFPKLAAKDLDNLVNYLQKLALANADLKTRCQLLIKELRR